MASSSQQQHYELSPVDGDYTQNWINHILTGDTRYFRFMDYAPELQAIPAEVITLIVKLCSQFNLTTDIEFSCFDTMDYFMSCKFEEMQKRLEMLKTRGQVKGDFGWIYVKKEFVATFEVTILSIISLVTKFFDGNQFRNSQMERLWRRLNQQEEVYVSLLSKEVEVLKILNYRIRKSQALEAIELFLVICVKPLLPMKLQDLLFLSIKILRIVYLNRNSIYSPLKPLLLKTPTNNNIFHAIQTDKVLMGAAVILASIKFLQIPSAMEGNVRKSIANASNLAVNDIKVLSKEMYRVAKLIFSGKNVPEA
ncbi:uncharacterized protein LOC129786375 [Lutzomyia longipalpis]|uniref:uncharacterized protein LOC129786375 n=1 Tax=Lutzomyia longipalpis TaxID=7200 RepID=UPI002483A9C7|nr:uncharacterized protein LOC129786375 [Lutzomyia longipalpis]